MRIDALADQEISNLAGAFRGLSCEILNLRPMIEDYRSRISNYGQAHIIEAIWTDIEKNYERYRILAYVQPTLEQIYTSFELFVIEDWKDVGKARAALDRLWEALTNSKSFTEDLPDIDSLGSAVNSLRTAFESMAHVRNRTEQERQEFDEHRTKLEQLVELLDPVRRLISPGDLRERIALLPLLAEKFGCSEDELIRFRGYSTIIEKAYNIMGQIEIVRDRTEALSEAISNSKVLCELAEEILLVKQLKSNFGSLGGDGPVRERLEKFEALREAMERRPSKSG